MVIYLSLVDFLSQLLIERKEKIREDVTAFQTINNLKSQGLLSESRNKLREKVFLQDFEN
jgi:hypothetical protein